MKNIPLPDLYYLENPDLKQLFRIMRISIFLEEFYKLKYCSTVVYMVPRA